MLPSDNTYEEFWARRGTRDSDKWSIEKEERVCDILEKLDFDSVLEVGCGEGEFSKLLLGYTDNIEGIDLNPHRVENSILPTCFLDNFIHHNYGDVTFDLVCCAHVLLHINPYDVSHFYSKMQALSNKHIVLIEPDYHQYVGGFNHELNYAHNYRTFDKFKEYDLGDKVVLFYT